MENSIEVRHLELSLAGIEFRAAENGDGGIGTLRGLGAVFNRKSEILAESFREIIEPGAFNDVLEDDVRVTINHSPDRILGRTGGPTPNARLWVDKRGLNYEVELPDTTDGRDAAELVARGILTGSSFSFQLVSDEDDTWENESRKLLLHKIQRIRKLVDLGPVVYPAYKSTRVSKRCLDMVHAIEELAPGVTLSLRRRRLDLEDDIR